MGSRVLSLSQPQTGRAAPEPLPALPACAPEVVAHVLGALLPQPVTSDEVMARAVNLGLLCLPESNQPARLTARVVSRLLLAGYRLPAHVEAGSIAALQTHLRTGRHASVLLHDPETTAGGPELLHVHDSATDLGFLVRPPGEPARPARLMAPEAFVQHWAAAGNFLIVALRDWSELPAEGRSFFAGTRDLDGTYHWDTAEVATDGEGRVLRC
jgi:hypothetical protein